MGNTDSGRKPFIVNQDRTIDPITVAFFCTSCPFKGVKTNVRNPDANGATNASQWTSEGIGQQAPMMHIQYVCNSPNFNFVQTIEQKSSTIGFGWCPFLEQKQALRLGGYDDGGD